MKKFFAIIIAALMSVSVLASKDVVPADTTLSNYYNAGQVCVCIYVPGDMACYEIVLTGSFNGWTTTLADCPKFEALKNYDGWYVAAFDPEAEPDEERGVQAKPIMLDGDGNFNWSYQVGAATVIRGGVQVISGYEGEIDLINYGTDAPNVYTVEAWKSNPCTAVYHNYTITVVSDGCDGKAVPYLVGGMNNWEFTPMQLDASQTFENDNVPTYSLSYRTAENTWYQIVSGLQDETGEIVVEPTWTDDAYIEALIDGEWVRLPGEEGEYNQLTGENANIVFDLRDEDKRWARCAPQEADKYTIILVNLPTENCPQAVEIIGSFDNWAGTAMEHLDNGWWFVELDAKASQYFKFRSAGSWERELEIYNAENDEWAKIDANQFKFGELWLDDSWKGVDCKMIELDWSAPDLYRWVNEAVPSDTKLAEYYNAGQVCVCINVPSDMACNEIVLTGSFNGWSSTVSDCPKFVAIDGYDGWYVTAFDPEEKPDAEKGIQAKPIMLDEDGNFNWEYQISAATVISGDVLVVESGYVGEIDMLFYGTDAPNVYTVDEWKQNPCTAIYHNYTITVISDGCNGNALPFLVGSMNNWSFEPMQKDDDKTEENNAPTYTASFKAAEGTGYQIVSGLVDETGETVEPGWTDESYMQKLVDNEWVRIPGEDGVNLITHEDANILFDLRSDTLRWARCADSQEEKVVLWTGNVLVGMGSETGQDCEADIFQTSDYDKDMFAGIQVGDLIMIETENAENSRYALYYWSMSNSEWVQFTTTDAVYKDSSYIYIKVVTEDVAQGIAENGIAVAGTCFNIVGIYAMCAQCKGSSEPGSGKVKIDGIFYNLDSYSNTAEVTYEGDDEYNSNPERYVGDVVIPESILYDNQTYTVTSIGSYSFRDCPNLTTINIPNTVTSIGFNAFQGCSSLSAISIPDSVTYIGDFAFSSCYNLISVTCEASTPPSMGEDVFYDAYNVSSQGTLYVPAESVELYKKAAVWSNFAHIKAIGSTRYYLVGSGEALGSWGLDNALPMEGDSITLHLASNAYEFKVLPQTDSWDNAMGYEYVSAECSSEGLTEGANGNVKFTLAQEGDVHVAVVNGQLCVNGVFGGEIAITSYTVIGDAVLFGAEWDIYNTSADMTQQKDGSWVYVIPSDTLYAGTYMYKFVANHTWSVMQYPDDERYYTFEIGTDGVYSITFTLIPGEGGTVTVTMIEDLSPVSSSAQLWPILLTGNALRDHLQYVVYDFIPNSEDINLYIWEQTYEAGEITGLNSNNEAEGYLALKVTDVGWSGGGFSLTGEKSTTAARTLLDEITKSPDDYYLHFAIKSTDNGGHKFYMLGNSDASFGFKGDGTSFPEGSTDADMHVTLEEFERDGTWQEYYVPMSKFADQLANIEISESGMNILCVLSGGVKGTQLNLDAIYFCNREMMKIMSGTDTIPEESVVTIMGLEIDPSQIDTAGVVDIYGDSTLVYKPEENMLILNNLTLEVGEDESTAIGYTGSEPLTIVLNDSSTIMADTIISSTADVIITGEGTLIAEGTVPIIGVPEAKITFDSVNMHVQSLPSAAAVRRRIRGGKRLDETGGPALSGFGSADFDKVDVTPSDAEYGEVEVSSSSSSSGSSEAVFALFVVNGAGEKEVLTEFTLTARADALSAVEQTRTPQPLDPTQPMYNILGMQVGADYKGIVIQNGNTYLR